MTPRNPDRDTSPRRAAFASFPDDGSRPNPAAACTVNGTAVDSMMRWVGLLRAEGENVLGLLSGVQRLGAPRGQFWTLTLTSVVAPGAIVVAECTFIGIRLFSPRPQSLHDIAVGIGQFHGAAGVLLTTLTLAVSYVVGYLARELAFLAVGKLDRSDPLADCMPHLRELFGKSLVRRCIHHHPVLRALDRDDARVTDARLGQGGHAETARMDVFRFCKLWLRSYAPTLGVDIYEVQINILVSTFAPVGLGALTAIVYTSEHYWWLDPAVVLLATGALVQLYRSTVNQRKSEKLLAVRNLVMDFAMREAAAGYPVVPEQLPREEPVEETNG